jgi:hypothetical protein
MPVSSGAVGTDWTVGHRANGSALAVDTASNGLSWGVGIQVLHQMLQLMMLVDVVVGDETRV